jgi:hypothetical protein
VTEQQAEAERFRRLIQEEEEEVVRSTAQTSALKDEALVDLQEVWIDRQTEWRASSAAGSVQRSVAMASVRLLSVLLEWLRMG